jgi:hypothetical protein
LNELTALDEEMSWLPPAILVEVSMLVEPPHVEDFIYRGWRLVTAPTPLCLWSGVLAGALAAASMVRIALTRTIVAAIVWVLV